jgi:hypothetical protein
VVIKVFFSVLVLCTAAVVAVVVRIHLQVKRHLRQKNIDAQIRPVIEGAAEAAAEEERAKLL